MKTLSEFSKDVPIYFPNYTLGWILLANRVRTIRDEKFLDRSKPLTAWSSYQRNYDFQKKESGFFSAKTTKVHEIVDEDVPIVLEFVINWMLLPRHRY